MYGLSYAEAVTTLTEAQRRTLLKGDCLVWIGAKDRDGYPMIKRKGMVMQVHRLACFVHHGNPTVRRYNACHTCDEPRCINGRHLQWQTKYRNAKDMVERGRWSKAGTRRPTLKLSLSEYHEIQISDRPIRELAAEHGCSYKTIQKIRRGDRDLG